jgi:hypothetical protein
MNASGVPPTPGDSYARLLLGAMGVMLVLCGMAAIWLLRAAGPLSIPPGGLLIACGLHLLYGCAYFDHAEIVPSRFGFPYVRVRRPPAADDDEKP